MGKTRKLFGLLLVLSMMLLYVQHRIRTPTLSKINSIIQQSQRQVVESRRDPHHIFCRPPPSRRELFVNQSSSQNISHNDAVYFENNKFQTKEKEINSIVFIQGHRAAGSTLQNILLRFAMTRNLNVLLPVNNVSSINDTGYQINKTLIVPAAMNQNYDIICHNIIFNKNELLNFFPKSTVYIGILRHPLYQSASALYYYAEKSRKDNTGNKYLLAFQASPRNPFQAFINKPSTYDVEAPSVSFTNNRQSVDLGFPTTAIFEGDKIDNSKITKFVEEVDRTFKLILISEMFDESLILLRHVLNWKMEDILYTKLHGNDEASFLSDIEGLSERDIAEHRKWETLDYALYGHFKSKLDGMILAKGEDFQNELQKFREIQEKVKKFCAMIKSSFRSLELRIQPTQWSSGFCVTPSFCDIVKKDDHDMTQLVRGHQMENVKIVSSL